jgi:O-antigen biosynthesis protein
VLIWLDDDGPYETLYGFPRTDVQSQYTGFNNSSHSGFTWCSPTAQLVPGNHSIRVRGVSRAGHTADMTRMFSLDTQSEYEVWADLHTATVEELARMRSESGGWSYQPKISIVTPVYRTPEEYLKKCIDSVQRQAYVNWELILVDDASGEAGLTALQEGYAAGDPRIRLRTLAVNAGIAGATNAGLEICTGEYVAFLDHDDTISPEALYHIVRTLNEDPSLDMLYSDQDKIDASGRRTDGLFKPDWSPDLLGSMNYVSHFLVCRREVLEAVCGLRLGFDGSQDYDLLLRVSERTEKIRRVPKVLYHWRIHPESAAFREDAKPASSDAGRRALNDHLLRTGVAAEAQEKGFNQYLIRYKISGQPEIGIVIPAGGSKKLRTALETVLQDSTYPNYRVVVVDNSSGGDVREWVKDFQGGRHLVERLDCRGVPFNFSLLCNRGAAQTTAPYVLFLNDDTSVITPDWLEAMLEHAQRPQVGAVGCMLLFPNGAIQHAGVVLGMIGVAGHPFRALDERKGPYYFGFSHLIRNCAAVTGACMLTRRQVFEEAGRFDETNLPTCFQDVDLCLKMGERGYRIVYTPHARLYHHESATKTMVAGLPEVKYMHSRWQKMIDNDPYYNPNLSRKSDCYDLDISGLLEAPRE